MLDLIYGGSRLLREAEKAGCATSDGGEMLLHQGAASFTLWTGQPAPLEVMEAALDEARSQGVTSAEGEPAAPEPAA